MAGACAERAGEVIALLARAAEHLEAPPLPFTLLEHSLQCAALLGESAPGDLDLQLAGLLHDVGHLLAPRQPAAHAAVAAAWLEPLLGERVAELIGLHVDAKRYLVSIDPTYRASLTMGSAQSLIAQGDVMSKEELARFSAQRHADDALRLRLADEGAKVPGRRVRGLEHWSQVLEERCASRGAR